MRTKDFGYIPTVIFSSNLDLRVVARDYLVELWNFLGARFGHKYYLLMKTRSSQSNYYPFYFFHHK